jgi:DHA1 family tetracycline resistance protein-like MFS transporter
VNIGESARRGEAPRGERPAALGFVYVAILMNVLSMGIIIPVFPTLVKSLTGADDGHAAQITGVFGAAWALMQLIFAPLFGALSDRFGRRPVLLVSMFGLAVDYLIMALAPSIAWLFIGRVISGITSASSSAAGAYVADVSTPQNRARNFGRFMAAANAGIVLGPALGGFVGQADPRAPFWVAAALALVNGLYGLVAVPESLGADRRAPFRWASAHALGAVSLLASKPGLLGLAGMVFLNQFAAMSFNSVFQFYTHYRFGWGPKDIGIFLMALGFGSIIIQSLVAGAAASRLGERRAVLWGLALGAAGFAVLGLASQVTVFWAGAGILIVSGISGPSAQSMMTQRVEVDEQGRLQGALSIFLGATGLIGPVLFTNAFAWSIAGGRGLGLPGLSILIGSGLIVGALAMAFVFARPLAAPRSPLATP